MKWHWIQVNGDTSKYSMLIEKKPLKEWGSLGNEGSNRLSRLWVEHHNESFLSDFGSMCGDKRRRGGQDKEYYAKRSKPFSKKHG